MPQLLLDDAEVGMLRDILQGALNRAGAAKLLDRLNYIVERVAPAEVRDLARDTYCDDTHDIEVDDKPSTSVVDEGAWIAAWLWLTVDELHEIGYTVKDEKIVKSPTENVDNDDSAEV